MAKTKGLYFHNTRRGLMLRCIVHFSNNKDDSVFKLKKLDVEVGIYLATRGKSRRRGGKYFYSNLEVLANKVSTFSNRKKISTNAISESLTSLDKNNIIEYKKDKPNNPEKHKEKRGIKITLFDKDHYKKTLKNL
ncbi:hypothetical protein RJ41_07995 [Alteromonas marina]|uniref:Uncharacterized protein n=1 Tax=Alteromonas marina TaxID=203795 RepID=A0A0B3XY59_9ALTE|nr:hypothetical protein [Alteromonas marina]KHT54446.1 hypothetical protein RJ41_07995 [Alteromonas marina]